MKEKTAISDDLLAFDYVINYLWDVILGSNQSLDPHVREQLISVTVRSLAILGVDCLRRPEVTDIEFLCRLKDTCYGLRDLAVRGELKH